MTSPLESVLELDIRRRISLLREQIAEITLAFRLAKDNRQTQAAVGFLRTRSELIEELFRTQKELLQLLAADATGSDPDRTDSSTPIGFSNCAGGTDAPLGRPDAYQGSVDMAKRLARPCAQLRRDPFDRAGAARRLTQEAKSVPTMKFSPLTAVGPNGFLA